jgi:hypothetical protein
MTLLRRGCGIASWGLGWIRDDRRSGVFALDRWIASRRIVARICAGRDGSHFSALYQYRLAGHIRGRGECGGCRRCRGREDQQPHNQQCRKPSLRARPCFQVHASGTARPRERRHAARGQDFSRSWQKARRGQYRASKGRLSNMGITVTVHLIARGHLVHLHRN